MKSKHHSIATRFRTQLLTALVAVTLFGSSATPPVEAGIVSRCQILLESVIDIVTKDESHSTLSLDMWDNNTQLNNSPKYKDFPLALEKRLGFGLNGSVYVLDRAVASELGLENGAYVVKLPHRPRYGMERAFRWTERASVNEASFALELQFLLPQIEKRVDYPLRDNWVSGTLPMVPIEKILYSKRGTLMVKPLMKDFMDAGKLFTKYGKNLPPHVVSGLRKIFDFAQTVYKETGMTIDLKPQNLAWIESPETKARLGMKEDGFVFFELGKLISFPERYYGKPFEQYFERFLDMGKEISP